MQYSFCFKYGLFPIWYSPGTKILTHKKNLVHNYHTCEELVLNRHIYHWQNCEELESNANAADLGGGHFINVRNTKMYACLLLRFDFVRIFHKARDIGMKYVTYWYHSFTCCEELEQIFFTAWTERKVKFPVQKCCLPINSIVLFSDRSSCRYAAGVVELHPEVDIVLISYNMHVLLT